MTAYKKLVTLMVFITFTIIWAALTKTNQDRVKAILLIPMWNGPRGNRYRLGVEYVWNMGLYEYWKLDHSRGRRSGLLRRGWILRNPIARRCLWYLGI